MSSEASSSTCPGTPRSARPVGPDARLLLAHGVRPLDAGLAVLTSEQVMEPAPSTLRADTPPARLHERLTRQDLKTAVITNPEGHLRGVVRRENLAQR